MKPKIGSRQVGFGAILILMWLIVSILLTVRSYSYSDHLTYSDVEITTDEGLISFSVPLVRLAHGHDSTNRWQTYTRYKANGWVTDRWVTADGGTKFRVREYFAMLGNRGNDKTLSTGMFCGFGYMCADATWTSDSRPGPLLWILAPAWAFTAISTIAIGVPVFLRAQFGLRSLMILSAIAAGILMLPTLHAPP